MKTRVLALELAIVVGVGAITALAFDDECIEYRLPQPTSTPRGPDLAVTIEQPVKKALPWWGALEGFPVDSTIDIRIEADGTPGRQIVADVQLLGDGSGVLTRPGTELRCRHMRWLVTLQDADGEVVLARDRFQLQLGSEAAIDHIAPGPGGGATRPRWQSELTLKLRTGVEELERDRARIKWNYANEVKVHPEAGAPSGIERVPYLQGVPLVVDRRHLASGGQADAYAAFMLVDVHGNETMFADGLSVGDHSETMSFVEMNMDPYRVPPRYSLLVGDDLPAGPQHRLALEIQGRSEPQAFGFLDVEVVSGHGPRVTLEAATNDDSDKLRIRAAEDNRRSLKLVVQIETTEGEHNPSAKLREVGQPDGGASNRVMLELSPGESRTIEIETVHFELGVMWWSVVPEEPDVVVSGWFSPRLARIPVGRVAGSAFVGLGPHMAIRQRGLLLLQHDEGTGSTRPATVTVSQDNEVEWSGRVTMLRYPGSDHWAAELLYVWGRSEATAEQKGDATVIKIPAGEAQLQATFDQVDYEPARPQIPDPKPRTPDP